MEIPSPFNQPQGNSISWFEHIKALPTATLAPDETIGMVMHMEMVDEKTKDKVQNIFTVIRRGNKAYARNIISNHIFTQIYEVAECNITDESILAKETALKAMTFATFLEQNNLGFKINTNQPAMVCITPQNSTTKELIAKFEQDGDPNGTVPKQAIIGIMKLKEQKSVVPLLQKEAIKTKPEKIKKPDNKTAIKEEKALIKKYGKKNIQALAKKMYYKGAIINKNEKFNKKDGPVPFDLSLLTQ